MRQPTYDREISAAAELPVHPITLRFILEARDLEATYRAHVLTHYLQHYRLCHWIAILFYAVYVFLDFFLAPDHITHFLVIRFAIVIPLFFIGIAISYASWYGRITNLMLAFYVVLTASGFVSMSLCAPPTHHFAYFLGILACLIFGYTFIRLPLLPAVAAGWLVVGIYWIVQSIAAMLADSAFYSYLSYLVGFNFLLMIICYSIERADRRNFFLSHLLVLERDKTERINEELEDLVAQRTTELRLTNERLSKEIKEHISSQKAKEQLERQLRHSQKMEAIGTLAGGIAHDFNNILGSVIGFTELAIDDSPPGSLLQSNLKEILTAGKRARDLVKQILSFSRQDEQPTNVVDLSKILQDVHHLLRATMPSNIELEMAIHHSANVLADAGQITQVMMNLGINAAQAIGSEGGKVTLILDKKVLEGAFCQQHPDILPGTYAMLSVTDTGCGISAESLERIFDPFYTTKPQGQGTGLGLSVVHGIIKHNNGTITVRSKVGEGTCFEVYLPIVSEAAQLVENNQVYLPTGHEHILCVDDEQSLLDFCRQVLTRLGYRVTIQSNPFDALDLIRLGLKDFDLILTDHSMPRMMGDVFIAEVRKLSPDIPVILYSGLKAAVNKTRLMNLRVAAILDKPLLKSDLAQTVRRILDRKATLEQDPGGTLAAVYSKKNSTI